MQNLRIYGSAPYHVAVIHGGPGAPGEMAPVARELAAEMGVLEPLQTANFVAGQLEELENTLEASDQPPFILIGYSWGAWLAYMSTAMNPVFIKKLILISCPPFEDSYTAKIMETRISHLNPAETEEALLLLSVLNSEGLKGDYFTRFGALMDKADSCDPLPHDSDVLPCSPDIYPFVWAEASKLRSSGELLRFGERITCPVVAIHGDYDPHPFQGVEEPLSHVLTDFRFVLLEHCGHHPWYERQARQPFFDILRRELML
jgi:pimeloyl-ACP methyl ester carboxylesterase